VVVSLKSSTATAAERASLVHVALQVWSCWRRYHFGFGGREGIEEVQDFDKLRDQIGHNAVPLHAQKRKAWHSQLH